MNEAMLKIVSIVFLFTLHRVNGFSYCDDARFCQQLGVLHTVCQYQGCGIGDRCISPKFVPIDKETADYILYKINALRNLIATGKDVRGGNDAAANMNALTYDSELAFVAQCWANQCIPGHDICRSTEKFEEVGQNIVSSGELGMSLRNWTLNAIQLWYDEIVNTNQQLIDKFVDSENLAKQGHFTQLVWAKTRSVGCGRFTYKTHLGQWTTLVCNFGPSGNVINEPVYIRGTPCSKCKSGCDDTFPGLCRYTEEFDLTPASRNSETKVINKSSAKELHLPLLYISLIILSLKFLESRLISKFEIS